MTKAIETVLMTILNTVRTAHRVVGKGVDVTGGPVEVYCHACAGNKIHDLRGRISDLLNPRRARS